MKSESLVIADQHVAVNTFPGLVHTARHTMGVGFTRSRLPNRKEGAYHGELHDWGEALTRWPYRKVRLEHLLSRARRSESFAPTPIGCASSAGRKSKKRQGL